MSISLSLSIDRSDTSMEIGDIPEELGQSVPILPWKRIISHVTMPERYVKCNWTTDRLPSTHDVDVFDSRSSRPQQISSSRVDDEGTMNTGVLSGGEFRSVSNTSLYPDDQMDMAFDLNISFIHILHLFANQSIWPSSASSRPTIEIFCEQLDKRYDQWIRNVR